MDPISISSAVASLLLAAPQILTAVERFSSASAAAERLGRTVVTEITSVKAIISQLRDFLHDELSAIPGRKEMILVDQVVETVTGLVRVFVDLQEETESLVAAADGRGRRLSILDRAMWTGAEAEIRNILSDLQQHKQSLNLMLTILLCNSIREARTCARDLGGPEEDMTTYSLAGSLSFDTTIAGDNAMLPELRDGISPSLQRQATTTSFEEALYSALPYRRVSLKHKGTYMESPSIYSRSFQSSGISRGWRSQLSGLSLAAVSNLSIIALPLLSQDIAQLVRDEGTVNINENSKLTTSRPLSIDESSYSEGRVTSPGVVSGSAMEGALSLRSPTTATSFENALYGAVPYRRVFGLDFKSNYDAHSLFTRSLESSFVPSGKFSQLSGVSLGALSNRSVRALPFHSRLRSHDQVKTSTQKDPLLEDVLNNCAPPPYTLDAFENHLRKSGHINLLKFHSDIERYKEEYRLSFSPALQGGIDIDISKSLQDVRHLWTKLRDTYLASNGALYVALPGHIREIILMAGNTPKPETLDDANEAACKKMEEGPFTSFLSDRFEPSETLERSGEEENEEEGLWMNQCIH